VPDGLIKANCPNSTEHEMRGNCLWVVHHYLSCLRVAKCATETPISFTVLLSQSLRTAADDSSMLVRHKSAKMRL